MGANSTCIVFKGKGVMETFFLQHIDLSHASIHSASTDKLTTPPPPVENPPIADA